ncbi:MAG: hypothetical protein ACK559_13475, partial [bacterium]
PLPPPLPCTRSSSSSSRPTSSAERRAQPVRRMRNSSGFSAGLPASCTGSTTRSSVSRSGAE